MINPQEQDSVFCVLFPKWLLTAGGGPLVSADILIRMRFRPAWTFWEREFLYRFRTHKNKDGQLVWLPEPLGDDLDLRWEDPVLERRGK